MKKNINRKLPVLFLSVLIIFGFTGCFEASNSKSEQSQSPSPETNAVTTISSKINTSLSNVFIEMQNNNLSLEQASKKIGIKSSNERILIDIGFSELNDSVIAEVKKTGVNPNVISKKYKRMSASFSDKNELKKLASIPQVTIINPEYGSITH